MSSTYFDCTDGSPVLSRLTNLPVFNACTFGVTARIDAYEDWGDLVIYSGSSGSFAGLEYDAAGNFFVQNQWSGHAYASSNIWTDSYKGWFRAVFTGDGTNMVGYAKRFLPGATIQTASISWTTTVAASRIDIGAATVFTTSAEGKHYIAEAFAAAALWSRQEIEAWLNSPYRGMPPRVADLTFYNDFRNGFTCNVDQTQTRRSDVGGHFTRTGVITTSLLDPGLRQRSLAAPDMPAAGGLSPADGSCSPTLTFAATGASLAAADGSSSPTLTVGATSAALKAADGSSSPTITVDATALASAQADASSAPSNNMAATGASLAAGAGSSAPALTVDATSAALKQAAGSSAPTITADATGASLAAAAASSAPSITVDATGGSGGSDAVSAPTLTVDATSAALFAGAGSSSPTLTVDAVSAALKVVAGSCSPTLTIDATGVWLHAAAGSCSPTITADMTSTTGSAGSSSPTLTFAATGASLAAAAGASAPDMTVNATGASKAAAAASCAPIITVNATSGGASTSGLWRPEYGIGSQLWRPDYYPAYV